MAYVDATAILTAVREALEDAGGTLRTIAATRFDGGLYDGLDVDAQTLRALDTPIAEARLISIDRHPDSPPRMHSMSLLTVNIEVDVVRSATLEHKLTDATRDTLKGLAAQDSDVIAQALTYPGNLTQTAAAAATNLVSGMLIHEGSSIEAAFDGATGARITSTHTFRGVVNVTQATS